MGQDRVGVKRPVLKYKDVDVGLNPVATRKEKKLKLDIRKGLCTEGATRT